jgi:hypothetical protein
MQSMPQTARSPLPTPESSVDTSRPPADRAYKMVTIAAILLVLCSLWVF